MADPQYGSEVAPAGPVQDMWQIDTIVGGPVDDRAGDQADFTGASGPAGLHGLGGQAEEPPAGGTHYDRIGF